MTGISKHPIIVTKTIHLHVHVYPFQQNNANLFLGHTTGASILFALCSPIMVLNILIISKMAV